MFKRSLLLLVNSHKASSASLFKYFRKPSLLTLLSITFFILYYFYYLNFCFIMRVSALILASATATQAFDISDLSHSLRRGLSSLAPRSFTLTSRKDGSSGSCPAVWSTISQALTPMFLANGVCNDDARAAIRMIFHDCGAWDQSLGFTNGCDGSLQFELGRGENGGLTPITQKAVALAAQYKVPVADMINFMGSMSTKTMTRLIALQLILNQPMPSLHVLAAHA